MSVDRQARIAAWLFVTPAAILLLLVFAAPLAKNVQIGFEAVTPETFISGEAKFIGLDNYRTVIDSANFGKLMTNTVVFTAGSIVFQFAIGLALALFFNKRFPLNGFLRSIVLLPWLLPLLVSTTTWRSMMDVDSGIINRGLMNSHLVDQPVPWLVSTSHAMLAVLIVNIWIGIPFNMTLLYAGLQEIPKELHEAASLDGAGRVRMFRYITWPLLRPVVAVVLVLGVVYTLKVLEIIVVLTRGGPADTTQTLATQSYFYSFANLQFSLGAATSNLLILLSLAFAVVYLRLNRKAAEV
ncbi:MAG: sugar ABC transporter permease [Mycobacteriales bacterium]